MPEDCVRARVRNEQRDGFGRHPLLGKVREPVIQARESCAKRSGSSSNNEVNDLLASVCRCWERARQERGGDVSLFIEGEEGGACGTFHVGAREHNRLGAPQTRYNRERLWTSPPTRICRSGGHAPSRAIAGRRVCARKPARRASERIEVIRQTAIRFRRAGTADAPAVKREPTRC